MMDRDIGTPVCKWRSRPNLREYCSCCSFGTRHGCMMDTDTELSPVIKVRVIRVHAEPKVIRIGHYKIPIAGRV